MMGRGGVVLFWIFAFLLSANSARAESQSGVGMTVIGFTGLIAAGISLV